nr:mitogen-activated protein kinase kinase kinase YODA [Ipomoea batatas]
MSSPSRSPMRVFGHDVKNSGFWPGKPYGDITFLGSGQCSSPGSGQNSGHNSVGGDIGQVFWPHSRCSPECSPVPSPRMASPGPSSRIHSGAVTPLHPRAGEASGESSTTWIDDGKQPSHLLPLPPPPITVSSPHFSPSYSAGASPVIPRSPDDAKSRESAQQLGQVDDKLYIYLEYVSGGSIYKILQEYGHLGEVAIRSYTQQILSGLAYLHGKSTVHRDIKGANILVDPNGRVKLADFGMAKHITGQSCPLSFKGSPYWMAPEVAAMFKIGNSKELPAIPDHLSDEGKNFVRQCLQRNPHHRPTAAAQLLDHPFVRNVAPIERAILSPGAGESVSPVLQPGIGHSRSPPCLETEGAAGLQSRNLKICLLE